MKIKSTIFAFNLINFLIMLLLFSCSRLEESERERTRKAHASSGWIVRSKDCKSPQLETPKHFVRELYPWEKIYSGSIPQITKEHFRCKGSLEHPAYRFKEEYLFDCDGRHGLALIGGKEGIYPILLDLLNYIQNQSGKKVVITSGHRCQRHATYADPSRAYAHSKHLLGAEVDFYVEGWEEEPMRSVELIQKFYKEDPFTSGKKEFTEFDRFEGKILISTLPWMNKEIFIKLVRAEEGRDGDNAHPFPYITIQVRWDRIGGTNPR